MLTGEENKCPNCLLIIFFFFFTVFVVFLIIKVLCSVVAVREICYSVTDCVKDKKAWKFLE